MDSNFPQVEWREEKVDKMAKGWSIAMPFSRERIRNVYQLNDEELQMAEHEGRVVLENVCLIVHSSVKNGQFKLPPDFWSILFAEYGIIVFPSALTEHVDTHGLNTDRTFTDCYREHVVMLGRSQASHPPPCPFEYLQQPPPVYQKYDSGSDTSETGSNDDCMGPCCNFGKG